MALVWLSKAFDWHEAQIIVVQSWFEELERLSERECPLHIGQDGHNLSDETVPLGTLHREKKDGSLQFDSREARCRRIR